VASVEAGGVAAVEEAVEDSVVAEEAESAVEAVAVERRR
jgi:hypothetical protein